MEDGSFGTVAKDSKKCESMNTKSSSVLYFYNLICVSFRGLCRKIEKHFIAEIKFTKYIRETVNKKSYNLLVK